MKKVEYTFTEKEFNEFIDELLKPYIGSKCIPEYKPMPPFGTQRECQSCRYYMGGAESWGHCKFNAPFHTKEERCLPPDHEGKRLIRDWVETEWVKVSPNDWCGQYQYIKR